MNETLKTTMSEAEIKESNAHIIEWAQSDMPEDNVKIASATQDLIRARVREGSISRNIQVPKPVVPADLIPDIVQNTDDPLYLGEIEPDTPGGVVVPIGGQTSSYYFYGRRYLARFGRPMTPRYVKDTSQLLTYKNDLRQLFSDMSLKDLLALEDAYFFSAINNMLAPFCSAAGNPLKAGDVVPATGNIQWRTIAAGVTPVSVTDALTVMGESNLGVTPQTVVVNWNFAQQFMKWTHADVGPQLVDEFKRKGFIEREFMNVRWLITIKNWLVGNGTMYIFGPGAFVGPSLILTDTTMHVKKDATMISFWAYEEISQVLGNPAAFCRVDLTQVGPSQAFPTYIYA
jgi:hypothetical protein